MVSGLCKLGNVSSLISLVKIQQPDSLGRSVTRYSWSGIINGKDSLPCRRRNGQCLNEWLFFTSKIGSSSRLKYHHFIGIMEWEHLVLPVVEQEPIVLTTDLRFWRKDIEQAGDIEVGVGTTISDKGQACSFKLLTEPDSNIYTELFAPSDLFLAWLHRMGITAHGSCIIYLITVEKKSLGNNRIV